MQVRADKQSRQFRRQYDRQKGSGELLLLSAACIVSSTGHLLSLDHSGAVAVLFASSILFTAGLGAGLYSSILNRSAALWAPIFWFRLSALVYFGIGTMIPYLVDQLTLERILRVHAFSDESAVKATLIWQIGAFITLLTARMLVGSAQEGSRINSQRSATKSDAHGIGRLGLMFLAVGAAVRYVVALPYQFGLFGTDTVPGIILVVQDVFYLGIFFLVKAATGGNTRATTLVVMLIVLEIAVSLATFAKTELIMLIIFTSLGILSVKITPRRLVAVGSLAVIAFLSFQPIVQYGRSVLIERYGKIQAASLSERLEIISTGLFDGIPAINAEAESGSAWSRLSYLNVNTFVVDRFDQGFPGDTLRDFWAVFVPRAIWSDKPIITQLGSDLYILVSGRDGSQMGVGHFGEAYWNFGWPGVLVTAPLIGLILGRFSRYSIRKIENDEQIFFPVVLLGIAIGFRTDGHIVPDLVGPLWTAVLMHFGLSLTANIFGEPARTRRGWVRE